MNRSPEVRTTALLVIGAGPYGLSVAARAREHGIDTVVLGRPMESWREQMPEGMFLRSGVDWHLDAAGLHTLEAYLDERRIAPAEVDPIPVNVFLEYAEWFRARKKLEIHGGLVTHLTQHDGRFEAVLEGGERIAARWVVAAPGIGYFASRPPWANRLDPTRAMHTSRRVRFRDLAGARVLVVGGRQSAYEWAALIAEAGAERIDIVHRHPVPAFDRISWKFAEACVEETLRTRGWWRQLPRDEREAMERQFWETGRLTLEWWLTPRLERAALHRWPGTEVVEATTGRRDGAVAVRLSNGERLTMDHVVLATGYQADLSRVPYLRELLGRIDRLDGFPVLNDRFGSSVDGLYIPGFLATRDFGPVFGFVKGSPAAATIIVEDIVSRRRCDRSPARLSSAGALELSSPRAPWRGGCTVGGASAAVPPG